MREKGLTSGTRARIQAGGGGGTSGNGPLNPEEAGHKSGEISHTASDLSGYLVQSANIGIVLALGSLAI